MVVGGATYAGELIRRNRPGCDLPREIGAAAGEGFVAAFAWPVRCARIVQWAIWGVREDLKPPPELRVWLGYPPPQPPSRPRDYVDDRGDWNSFTSINGGAFKPELRDYDDDRNDWEAGGDRDWKADRDRDICDIEWLKRRTA